MKKFVILCSVAALVSGCSYFDKDPLQIDGVRQRVIRENKNLQPEYTAGQFKIRLPKALENSSWQQSGCNAEHACGHLKAGGNLDEIWQESFGEGSSKRNPIVTNYVSVDDKLFTMDAEALVTAFDLSKGKILWERKLKPQNKEAKNSSLLGGGIAVYDGRIFAATGFGELFALDYQDGKILWQQNLHSPLRAAPSVDDELVIVQTFDNGIYAIKIVDGSILWKDKIEAETTTIIGGASPAYSPADDLVVAAFSNGQLQAYKASTGTPLWAAWLTSSSTTESLADITSIKANPVINDGKVFAVGYNTPLAAIDMRTGVKVWQKEIAAANQPWVAGNILFVLTNDNDLVAINKNEGKIIWTTILPVANEDGEQVTLKGPVLANDALLVVTSNGKLFSVSPYNGRIMGVAEVEEGIVFAPVVVKQSLILATDEAEVTVYR